VASEPSPFAARLRTLIALAGISIPELAARSGLSRQHVHQILEGATKRLEWETVCKLCEGLGVSADVFRQ
jgi:transcriptional regulator with XRE-family HTH domain